DFSIGYDKVRIVDGSTSIARNHSGTIKERAVALVHITSDRISATGGEAHQDQTHQGFCMTSHLKELLANNDHSRFAILTQLARLKGRKRNCVSAIRGFAQRNPRG